MPDMFQSRISTAADSSANMRSFLCCLLYTSDVYKRQNQINNVLAFPGIFRGALDVRASDINDEMKIAAAYAIASLVDDNELSADHIIPEPFDPRVCQAVASAVAEAARKTGVARI